MQPLIGVRKVGNLLDTEEKMEDEVPLSSLLDEETRQELIRSTSASLQWQKLRPRRCQGALLMSESNYNARVLPSSRELSMTKPLDTRLLDDQSEDPNMIANQFRKPSYHHSHSVPVMSNESPADVIMRLSNQARYRKRSSLSSLRQSNRIKLHIYDLIATETVMQLPWGCYFPIGTCFNAVNAGLHSIGTGAYHVGIDINGIEYSFGACETEGSTGVFSCIPTRSPGYQYRSTIDFGEIGLMKKEMINVGSIGEETTDKATAPAYREVERFVDGREVIKQMASEYMGVDYDLLRKNCCTFAHDACLRLGINEETIPSWFRNLSDTGAMTQDFAASTVEPISTILLSCEDFAMSDTHIGEDGLEVVDRVDSVVVRKNLGVVDNVRRRKRSGIDPQGGFQQTLSWAY